MPTPAIHTFIGKSRAWGGRVVFVAPGGGRSRVTRVFSNGSFYAQGRGIVSDPKNLRVVCRGKPGAKKRAARWAADGLYYEVRHIELGLVRGRWVRFVVFADGTCQATRKKHIRTIGSVMRVSPLDRRWHNRSGFAVQFGPDRGDEAWAAARGASADAPPAGRRLSPFDGYWHTLKEFVAFFGPGEGRARWAEAEGVRLVPRREEDSPIGRVLRTALQFAAVHGPEEGARRWEQAGTGEK